MSQKILRANMLCSLVFLLTSCDGDFVWVDEQKTVLCSMLLAILIMCIGGFWGILRKSRKD